MSLFDTYVMVDWSARSSPSPARPSKDAIWWCVARQGGVEAPVYCRTRAEARDRLRTLIQEEAAAGRRTLVGFDFPVGYPAGVAQTLTGRPEALALWRWLADRIEDGPDNANNRYSVAEEINRHYAGIGPCWGRPASWDHPDVPTTAKARTSNQTFAGRQPRIAPDPAPQGGRDCAPPRGQAQCLPIQEHPPEHRLADKMAKGAKTVWQLAYAGSVGSQVLVGLPVLLHLRETTGARVWPFDTGLATPDAQTVIAEIYPGLLQAEAKAEKREHEPLDAAQVRIVARSLAALDATDDLAALFSPALEEADRQTVETEEGWILGLGFEHKLRAAAARPQPGQSREAPAPLHQKGFRCSRIGDPAA